MKITPQIIEGKLYCRFEDVKQMKEFYEDKLSKAKSVVVEGWKGKDKINFERNDAEWLVTEHRKDKKTGNIATAIHKIQHKNVVRIWSYILRKTELNEEIKTKELALDLIFNLSLDIDTDSFWGGKNRAKYYFPLLYYPIKILEYLQYVEYGGGGKVKRLKEVQLE